MSATALWFGDEERPLFGWVHKPDQLGSAPAAVLCPPLGREMIDTHYSFRVLAETLAAAGLLVVRFDYDGTGDSAGDATDPERIESWLESIQRATELARAHGARALSLIGLRMGSLLAEIAAARMGDVDAMVLWDPCENGRAFVRHQRALERLRANPTPDRPRYDGAPGGQITPATLDEIKQLTLSHAGSSETETAATSLTAPPTLVLHRPEDSGLGALLRRLDGRLLDVVAVEGQPEMLDVLDERKIIAPSTTISAITDWLVNVLSPDRAHVPAVVPANWFATDELATVATGEDGQIRERIIKVGELGLFGIETVPAGSSPSLPAIVMFNSGPDWRCGPNRMWVRLSRAWAQMGYRCVRFDLSGLGDSPVRPGQAFQVPGAPEAFDDLEDALRSLNPEDPSNVILVGLCSGGYQALESGLTLHPRAIFAINPNLAFAPPEAAAGPVDPRRRICIPTNVATVGFYRRLVSAQLRDVLRPLVWRARRLLADGLRRQSWISELLAAGTDVICICGEHDLFQLPPEARSAIPASGDGGSLQVHVIENLNHALLHPLDQEQSIAIIDQYLSARSALSEGKETPTISGAQRQPGELASAQA